MHERAETHRQPEDSQQGQLVCKLFNFRLVIKLCRIIFKFANLQTISHSNIPIQFCARHSLALSVCLVILQYGVCDIRERVIEVVLIMS